MPCRIPDVKRRRIEVGIALKKRTKDLAKTVNVSRRSIQRFSKNLKVHGSIGAPKVIAQGRPRTITPEMEEVSLTSPLQVVFHSVMH
jgi:transposase